SVYPASAVAVPVLVQMLENVGASRRAKLLCLVWALGVGDPYHYKASMFRFVGGAGADAPEPRPPESEDCCSTRRAHSCHLPVSPGGLEHADGPAVLAAAGVLELSGSERERLLAFAEPALDKTDIGPVRAAVIYLELTAVEPARRFAVARSRLEAEQTAEAR